MLCTAATRRAPTRTGSPSGMRTSRVMRASVHAHGARRLDRRRIGRPQAADEAAQRAAGRDRPRRRSGPGPGRSRRCPSSRRAGTAATRRGEQRDQEPEQGERRRHLGGAEDGVRDGARPAASGRQPSRAAARDGEREGEGAERRATRCCARARRDTPSARARYSTTSDRWSKSAERAAAPARRAEDQRGGRGQPARAERGPCSKARHGEAGEHDPEAGAEHGPRARRPAVEEPVRGEPGAPSSATAMADDEQRRRAITARAAPADLAATAERGDHGGADGRAPAQAARPAARAEAGSARPRARRGRRGRRRAASTTAPAQDERCRQRSRGAAQATPANARDRSGTSAQQTLLLQIALRDRPAPAGPRRRSGR